MFVKIGRCFFDRVHPAVYMLKHIYIYIMIHNVQSNTAKFFIIDVNQKGKMFRQFLDRRQQAFLQTIPRKERSHWRGILVYCLLEGLMMAIYKNAETCYLSD
jgi:hypothetical protein